MFFDDILIYYNSFTEHLQHICIALNTLRTHNMFLKCSKCSLADQKVEYLDHFISEAGVAMDPAKVEAV